MKRLEERDVQMDHRKIDLAHLYVLVERLPQLDVLCLPGHVHHSQRQSVQDELLDREANRRNNLAGPL
jgi:hypothetical protein